MTTEVAMQETSDPVVTLMTSRRERQDERRARLTGALAEIREMDGELEAAKAEIVSLRQRLAEAQAMIEFLDRRNLDLDKDRMTYAKEAVGLARTQRAIWHLCNDAARMAAAAEALGIEGTPDTP
jgi:hypothetical protein